MKRWLVFLMIFLVTCGILSSPSCLIPKGLRVSDYAVSWRDLPLTAFLEPSSNRLHGPGVQTRPIRWYIILIQAPVYIRWCISVITIFLLSCMTRPLPISIFIVCDRMKRERPYRNISLNTVPKKTIWTIFGISTSRLLYNVRLTLIQSRMAFVVL